MALIGAFCNAIVCSGVRTQRMKQVEIAKPQVAHTGVAHYRPAGEQTKPHKKPGAERHPVRTFGLVHGLPTIDNDGLAGQIGTHV
jgi:hypothetical protein